MNTKNTIIVVLAMALCQAGCEYYGVDDQATIDGGEKTIQQGMSDEDIDAVSKQVEDLKKEMSEANAEEIRVLKEKIAELEKKLGGGSGGGSGTSGTTTGGTTTGGTTTGGTTTGGGGGGDNVKEPATTTITSLSAIAGTWKATTFIVTDHQDSKKYDQLKEGYSFQITITGPDAIAFKTTKPDNSMSTGNTKIAVTGPNTLKLEEQPEPFTAALIGNIMTWTGWKDEKDPIEAVWQKQ